MRTYVTNLLLDDIVNDQLTLKGGQTSDTLCTNIFSESFFNINYELFYDNDDFQKMSDGKKSFVVLKLLLEFSEKKCPILIDQPEDSLDNRAIHNELVQYIRNKKQKRQIILVTHNANIVVGADSELVVVSNQHGNNTKNRDSNKFQYVRGSIEHTSPIKQEVDIVLESKGIREHVCEILEGGKIAFKNREKRYGLFD